MLDWFIRLFAALCGNSMHPTDQEEHEKCLKK